MRHILIILSIFLLSSPVIGISHKGETLYGWGEGYDGYVWKGFGDKETQPVYKGEVENGVPNGLGFLIYPSGTKYVGSWGNGKENGQGTITTQEGTKYKGKWKDGERHGQGTITYPNGSWYTGEWKDGTYNGQGTYFWSDGKWYKGEYKDGNIWNGIKYDNDGNIIGKHVNGVKQK